MGTARAPVAGSGFWPACRERVLKPIWRSGVDSGISYQFSLLVTSLLEIFRALAFEGLRLYVRPISPGAVRLNEIGRASGPTGVQTCALPISYRTSLACL